jgi:hypothetical protein
MAKERHYTREDLDALTKDELETLAEKRELTVTRGDGTEGDPLKADYVDALAASYGEAPADGEGSPAIITSKSREKSADETIPGGRYVNAQGHFVNAHGNHIDADGNEVEKPVKAPTR